MINIFGERLKKLRIEKKYTQEQLASLLNVNRMTVVKWEKGSSEPTLSIVRYLANLFNVDYSYMVGEDQFTLFLIVMAERFSQARKENNSRRNDQIELAEWIIYWNDLLENIFNGNYKYELHAYEDKLNRIGWSIEYDKVVLNFPEDYSKSIIDYIINVDIDGLTGSYTDCEMPHEIQDMMSSFFEEKPQLYKYLYDLKI